MCYTILNDNKTYSKLVNCDTSYSYSFNNLHNILKKYNMHEYIKRDNTNAIVSYKTTLYKYPMQLQNSHLLKTANFYALPKMHKISSANPSPSGRPIVSSKNSCTYFISKYLLKNLNTLTNKFHTICTSTLEVIYVTCKLELPDYAHILCADVKSLYPSIPISFGINAVKTLLICFNITDIDFHKELLHWVLVNNFFKFNNDIYLQKYGTAMGTPAAVEYANTVLYFIEHSILDSYKPILYLRYIDDIFAIFPSTAICNNFYTLFNTQCPDIQLESVPIDTKGIFLDLHLEIKNNSIISNIYQKPVNKYLYLPPTSEHASHIMINVIKSELKRFDFIVHLTLIFNELKIISMNVYVQEDIHYPT